MNFLAHLYLAGDSPESMVGNLAADFMRGRIVKELPSDIYNGVLLHREVDRFTDSHALWKKSGEVFRPHWGRYSGILVDVYYDHLLAKHWERFCAQPLREFLDQRYDLILAHLDSLPEEAASRLRRIVEGDLLGSYEQLHGIEAALRRIKRRLRNPAPLEDSIVHFLHAESEITEDFNAFFPELIAFVDAINRDALDCR